MESLLHSERTCETGPKEKWMKQDYNFRWKEKLLLRGKVAVAWEIMMIGIIGASPVQRQHVSFTYTLTTGRSDRAPDPSPQPHQTLAAVPTIIASVVIISSVNWKSRISKTYSSWVTFRISRTCFVGFTSLR